MIESNELRLCVPKVNSAAQNTEIGVEETIKFFNGNLSFGTGSLLIFDLFDKFKVVFEDAHKIEAENLVDGVLTIDRSNIDTNIWNPFLLSYKVNEAQSPVSVDISKNKISVKIMAKSTQLDDLKLNIKISEQSSRMRLNLMPNNLSHAAKYENETKIVWKIEYPRFGSSYILTFTGKCLNFKVLEIEASYTISDELCSGLVFKIISLSKNGSKLNSVPVIKKSKIKEFISL